MSLESQLQAALDSGKREAIESVFEDIYGEYHGIVSFCASQYLKNDLDIQEITDDVFLNFFNHLKSVNFTSIKYYLVQSAKNLALNKAKQISNRREVSLIDNDDQFVDEDGIQVEDNSFIEDLKRILSKEDYTILVDYVLYDKTSQEIAAELNMTDANVRMRYHRLVKKVREELGDKYNV